MKWPSLRQPLKVVYSFIQHIFIEGLLWHLGIQWWTRQSPCPHSATPCDVPSYLSFPHSFVPTAWLFLSFDLSWTHLDSLGGRRRGDDITTAIAISGRRNQGSVKELVMFQIGTRSHVWTTGPCLSALSRFTVEAVWLLHIKTIIIKHVNMVLPGGHLVPSDHGSPIEF